ncbi:S9 family peptidase [Salegentibacter salegens]|uniref:Dipeptidyl aminopeptidase/acylaminoacyl peptidase n=1 Tax=Salegentibacter salegens TaxID=143223 RepID=A0A1M7JYU7_9FLAO|nr:S9 family peptidase [Salegentibacter salegens]PRX43003.1 dipeptidyl aminopeptidase/acylaminoacyl peptidase [Salegentibacter salegens]SHM58144.1 Dipeptidyl aminopeptidase/acylaminoacyl peptidase [Salegentibacter salegens]
MKYFIYLMAFLSLPVFAQQNQEPEDYTIEQFYENTRIGGGYFSPEEDKILVSSDKSGIFNLFEIDISSAEMQQVTSSEEDSYFAIDYVPNSENILYSADKGGNEINHIYLLEENGTSTDLTSGENEKSQFAGWNNEKTGFYYLSNKRNPQFFDLYEMDMQSRESELIYKNEENLSFEDISHNGKLIALTKAITTSENKLYLYHLETEEMTELSEESAQYSASGFSKNDEHFYYITNAGREFKSLIAYNLETNQSSNLFETNWDVMYSYLSENDKYRVIGINEDGKNSLIIENTETGEEVDLPDMENEDIVAVNISNSEELMRLTIGTAKAPNNLYIYNFSSGELKKLTNTLNPKINSEDLVSAEVVRYESFDGLEIPAIYYKPHQATKNNKVPALVWVHGGPGGQSRVGYSALIQYLVNQGYAILAVNNRGSSGYGKSFFKMDDKKHGDEDLKDCIWGKKWLQQQEYIDSEKIGILGGSYGGYMTMAAMTFTPDEFKAGVNIFGVTNWLRTLKSIPPYWEAFREALYEEMGDPVKDSIALYNKSPLFHAEQVKNPVMVLQGANDPRVLQVESDEIVAALKENDVPVEYVVFEDEGHGFIKKENEIEGYRQIRQFLDKYLKEED